MREGICTGDCCARFPIGWFNTHEELLEHLNSRTDREGVKILEMIIPTPNDDKFPYQTYTCKYWDSTTKLCSNYQGRPDMCALYPYNTFCRQCGMIYSMAADENYLGE